MPGANCSLFGCGTSRKHKDIGIFKLPLPKDAFHRKWREDLINVILEHRVLDDNLKRQISEDRIHICQKHFTEDQFYVYPSRKLLKEGAIPTLNLVPEVVPVVDMDKDETAASSNKKHSGRKFKTRYHERLSPTYPFSPPSHLNNVAESASMPQLHSVQSLSNEPGIENTSTSNVSSLEMENSGLSKTNSFVPIHKQDSSSRTRIENFPSYIKDHTKRSNIGPLLLTRVNSSVEESHGHTGASVREQESCVWKERNYCAAYVEPRAAVTTTTLFDNLQNTSKILPTPVTLHSRRRRSPSFDGVVVIADGHNNHFSSMSNPRLTFAPEHCIPQPPKLTKTRLLSMYPSPSSGSTSLFTTIPSSVNSTNRASNCCVFVESKISDTGCCEKTTKDSATLTYTQDYFRRFPSKHRHSSLSENALANNTTHSYANKTVDGIRHAPNRASVNVWTEFTPNCSYHDERQMRFGRHYDEEKAETRKTSSDIFSNSSVGVVNALDDVRHVGEMRPFSSVEPDRRVDDEIDIVRIPYDVRHVGDETSLSNINSDGRVDDPVDTYDDLIVPRLGYNNEFNK